MFRDENYYISSASISQGVIRWAAEVQFWIWTITKSSRGYYHKNGAKAAKATAAREMGRAFLSVMILA